MGMCTPEEYDGMGLDTVTYLMALEEISAADAAFAVSIGIHNAIPTTMLVKHGTREQRERWLKPMARGEILAGFALSEPEAGSDAASLRSQATKDGKDWVLNGAKAWATNAGTADLMMVMVRTDQPNARRGAKGISTFIVPTDSKGYKAAKPEDKMGLRASNTAGIELNDLRVPATQMLGDEERDVVGQRTTFLLGLPQQDRELALRLWHGCVFMDRMVAMTLGRPTMIPKADALAVPFPAAIDDQYLSPKLGDDHSQPQEQISIVEFYVQSLKLYIINEETLSTMYKSDGSDGPPSAMTKLANLDLNTILRLDSAITDWYDSLPKKLKVRSNPVDDFTEPIFARQSNILRLRCLQVQILLFRPVLLLLLAPEIRSRATNLPNPGTWIALDMGLVCVRKCILNALEVINIIYLRQHKRPSSMVEPLPAWWYEVFCKSTGNLCIVEKSSIFVNF